MTRVELLETYLKQTDLTVKELIDRNALSQIIQFAEAYRFEQLRLSNIDKSFYCQSEIEMEDKCDEQCKHCKEYYKPLKQ